MIDPTQKMYDSEGREWVALRLPDGSVWRYRSHTFYACRADDPNVMRTFEDSGRSGAGFTTLSNTKPQKDWSTDVLALTPSGYLCETMKLRYGIKNGLPFAEVVDESLPT